MNTDDSKRPAAAEAACQGTVRVLGQPGLPKLEVCKDYQCCYVCRRRWMRVRVISRRTCDEFKPALKQALGLGRRFDQH